MADPYMAEIRVFTFPFAPRNWALCNGQLLPIQQNQALFALLGTAFGGNGQTTFGLPNLQGKVPMHMGQGHVIGEQAGEYNHTLIINEMPSHPHFAQGSPTNADSPNPLNNVLGTALNVYRPIDANLTTLSPSAISNTGGSSPHNNTQPYLTVNFCIALAGIFPSRN